MVTYLEPDILECEGKWAIGSITMNKASGGDGIPVELFQILKENAAKVLHSICHKFGKFSNGHSSGIPRTFQFQGKAMPKNVQFFYCTIALISQANKVMLKIFQARL